MPTNGWRRAIWGGSNDKPVQSPQLKLFSMAVGTNETRSAASMTNRLATGWENNRGASGRNKMPHSSSNGRLPDLAPVSSAADNSDSHTSQIRRERAARKAKSTAASANTAAKGSLPRLPAWSRKLYPVGSSHIHCHATRPLTPSLVKTLKINPGRRRKDRKFTRNKAPPDLIFSVRSEKHTPE